MRPLRKKKRKSDAGLQPAEWRPEDQQVCRGANVSGGESLKLSWVECGFWKPISSSLNMFHPFYSGKLSGEEGLSECRDEWHTSGTGRGVHLWLQIPRHMYHTERRCLCHHEIRRSAGESSPAGVWVKNTWNRKSWQVCIYVYMAPGLLSPYPTAHLGTFVAEVVHFLDLTPTATVQSSLGMCVAVALQRSFVNKFIIITTGKKRILSKKYKLWRLHQNIAWLLRPCSIYIWFRFLNA